MKRRDGFVWTVSLAAASVIGCGSPVVDPGRAVNRFPPPMQQPASPSELPTLEAHEVQQVPAESVFNLPNESNTATYHTVQSGETLSNIAKRLRRQHGQTSFGQRTGCVCPAQVSAVAVHPQVVRMWLFCSSEDNQSCRTKRCGLHGG